MYVEHFYALTAGSGNLITFLLQAQKNFIFSPFGMPETGSIGGAKRIKPVLFLMVFLLKTLTQVSFPELKETKIFWIVSYLLSTFALITLFAEIYFFKISLNWVFIFGFILLVYAYLTAEYISHRERI